MDKTTMRISNSTLTSLCDEFKKNNRIEPEKFEKYEVKRGLRNADGSGVMAGLTRICNVHGYVMNEGEKAPVEGRLIYRGIDINAGNWGLACMHEDSLFRVLAPKMNIAHFPIEEIGSTAVQILLNQIRQSNDPEAGEYVPESKVLPCRMEFRDQ